MSTFGKRLRHHRKQQGLTLAELGARVGRSASALSLLESGRREPKLSLITALAAALDVVPDALTSPEPPSRRAELELRLESAQADPLYRSLGLGRLQPAASLPTEVLEHLIGLYDELRRRDTKPAATPEEARLANAELRARMVERDNYFPAIEQAAVAALDRVGYRAGPLSEGLVLAMVRRSGFTLRYAEDLPRSVRSVADLRNRRIFLRREDLGMHTPRTILLQTLGHLELGHARPRDFGDFLRQRVEANYFAAAVLVPERSAAQYLLQAKRDRDLSVEDLRDVFSVSYEMAAHRFTNLATHILGLPCHFVRNDETGIIYKAYQNDGLAFPTDGVGAIEGQRMCRKWAGRMIFANADRFRTYYQYTDLEASGATYWCVAHVDPGRERNFAITVGVPYRESKWFRGRETTARARSRCPDGQCCRTPPLQLARRWDGQAWPSTRAHSHVLAVLPPGAFPGVDETDVYSFLDRYSG